MVKILYSPTKINYQSRYAKEALIICLAFTNKKVKLNYNFSIRKNSSLTIVILSLIKDSSQIELVTKQNHDEANGKSLLMCKSLLDSKSRFSFLGNIEISKNGNGTKSYQRNENLILDKDSSVISQPSLSILANNVFCTHGSFTSNLNRDELYFLQTRGLSMDSAKNLLKQGFLMSGLNYLLKEPEVNEKEFNSFSLKASQYFGFKQEK